MVASYGELWISQGRSEIHFLRQTGSVGSHVDTEPGGKMRNRTWRILFVITLLFWVSVLVYNIPPVKSRLDWRVDEFRAKIKYAISPPEQVVFIPQEQENTTIENTPTLESTTQPSLIPTISPVGPTVTYTPNPTSTPSPTPVPGSIRLTGFRHEYQGWNNCGPATLSMALSFWGWEGDQYDIAPITKPNPRDKNVMPYEMVDYVETQTDLKVIIRTGGKLDLLKQFVAAGFPVIIEKGFEGPEFDGWMGHYELITGYDETINRFTAQDSFIGPDLQLDYDYVKSYWRAFNFTYLVIYPEDRESEVLAILGLQSKKTFNDQFTAKRALDEIALLSGRDLFFAWFNRGSSLVALQDYAGAADAYDQAFTLYPSIPEKERPWRMLWYQTGPYWAYYYTGRYPDVIDLATKTLDNMSEPILEESYYWRALAQESMGDVTAAIYDLQLSLKYHPGFVPAQQQLQKLDEGPQP